jgi:hypothetical protein
MIVRRQQYGAKQCTSSRAPNNMPHVLSLASCIARNVSRVSRWSFNHLTYAYVYRGDIPTSTPTPQARSPEPSTQEPAQVNPSRRKYIQQSVTPSSSTPDRPRSNRSRATQASPGTRKQTPSLVRTAWSPVTALTHLKLQISEKFGEAKKAWDADPKHHGSEAITPPRPRPKRAASTKLGTRWPVQQCKSGLVTGGLRSSSRGSANDGTTGAGSAGATLE